MKTKFNNIKILAMAVLLAATWQGVLAQDIVDDDNLEMVEVSEGIDSKQYNKWTRSSHFKNGVDAMNKQKYEIAEEMLVKELKQHPHNGYAQCNLAWCKYLATNAAFNEVVYNLINNANDPDEAQKVYSRMRQSTLEDHNSYAAMMMKGIAMLPAADKESLCQAYLKHRDILKAAEADSALQVHSLQQAIKIHPCFSSYVEIMEFYVNLNDLDAATAYAIEAGDILSDDYTAQRLKATAFQYQKNYDKALSLIEKLMEQNSSDIDLRVARCEIYVDQGNYKNALADYDFMVKNFEPNEFDPLRLLSAIASIDPEARKAALDYVHQRQDIDDKTEGTLNWNVMEGMLLYSNNDYKESIKCYERGLETNKSAELIGIVASNYFMLGEVEKALALCDVADAIQRTEKNDDDSKDNSQDGTYLSRKIMIEMACGMTDQVLNDAKVHSIAYPSESNMINSLSTMGWAYQTKGQYKDAINSYEKWMEIDKDNAIARYNRARTMILGGINTAEAHEELREVLETEDFSGNEELKMSVLYYMGRHSEARELLDKLAANTDQVEAMSTIEREQATSLPEVMSLYNIACGYSLLGDTEHALSYLRRNFEGSGDASLYFNYAILDSDFDNVRQDPRFLDIINEFKTRWLNGDYKPLKK